MDNYIARNQLDEESAQELKLQKRKSGIKKQQNSTEKKRKNPKNKLKGRAQTVELG